VRPPVPGWPPRPVVPPFPVMPPELSAPPLPVVPPSLDLPPPPDPPVLPGPTAVLDEQAAPAIASVATVVRKKRPDVMRYSLGGISTVGVCHGLIRRPRSVRRPETPGQRPSSVAVTGEPEFRLPIHSKRQVRFPLPGGHVVGRSPASSAMTCPRRALDAAWERLVATYRAEMNVRKGAEAIFAKKR
jgi:hypothetical protein